jgi:hypothetical protein
MKLCLFGLPVVDWGFGVGLFPENFYSPENLLLSDRRFNTSGAHKITQHPILLGPQIKKVTEQHDFRNR